MKKRLEKHYVCDQCYSVGIQDLDCTCVHGKCEVIELEFEVCECCGNLTDDGKPADTKFNDEQLKSTN